MGPSSSDDEDDDSSSQETPETPQPPSPEKQKKKKTTPARAAKTKAASNLATASNKKNKSTTKRQQSKQKLLPTKKQNKKTPPLETIKEEIEYKTSRCVPNYVVHEDAWLTKAYVSTTSNQAKGKDRSATDFWNEVKERYDTLAHQDPSVTVYENRDAGSLMNRYQKAISKQVQYWNKYYKKAKQLCPSGSNEEMFYDKANVIFADMEGKSFKMAHCVPILHQLPKWRPTWIDNGWSDDIVEQEEATEETPGDEEEKKPAAKHNKLGRAAGDDLERPIGTKKFKKEIAEAASAASLASSNANVAEALVASNDRLGAKLQDSLSSLAESNKNKVKHAVTLGRINQLIEMSKLYSEMGDIANSKKLLDQAQQLQDEQYNLVLEQSQATTAVESQAASILMPPSVVRTTTATNQDAFDEYHSSFAQKAGGSVDSPIDSQEDDEETQDLLNKGVFKA